MSQNPTNVMEQQDLRPQLTIEQVRTLLFSEYSIATKVLKPLESERDQNFYVQDNFGREFVFKVSNVEEDFELLDMQNKIFQHLARAGVPCPELVLTNSHKEMFPFYAPNKHKPHYGRLLKWIPGKVFASIQHHSNSLLRDLGRALAKIDQTLQTFTHPAMYRPTLIWEMHNTSLLKPFFPFLEQTNPPERVQIARHSVQYFEEHIHSYLNSNFVKCGVSHNDANDWNIIVNEEENAVVALIDYGDACFTAYVCNLAICMAYCMLLNKKRCLEVAKQVFLGYQSLFPLSSLEIEMLPSLIKLRLATSVIVSSKRMLERPNDPYVIGRFLSHTLFSLENVVLFDKVSQKPAWELLELLSQMSLDSLVQLFKSWTKE